MIAPISTPAVSPRTVSTAVVTKDVNAAAGRINASTRSSGTASTKPSPKITPMRVGARTTSHGGNTGGPDATQQREDGAPPEPSTPLTRAIRGSNANPMASSSDWNARTRRSPAENNPSDAASNREE